MSYNDPFKQIREMSRNARIASDQRALNRRIDESYAAGRRTIEANLQRVREAEARRQKNSLSRPKDGPVSGNRTSGGLKSIFLFLVILMVLFGAFAGFVLVVAGLRSSPFG